jgi:hypothetical protein
MSAAAGQAELHTFSLIKNLIDWLGHARSAPSISAQKEFRNAGEAYRSDDYS